MVFEIYIYIYIIMVGVGEKFNKPNIEPYKAWIEHHYNIQNYLYNVWPSSPSPHCLINQIFTLSPVTNQLGAWGNLSFNWFVQLSIKRKLVKHGQVPISLHINIYCVSPTFNCIQICNWNCPHILPHAQHSRVYPISPPKETISSKLIKPTFEAWFLPKVFQTHPIKTHQSYWAIG